MSCLFKRLPFAIGNANCRGNMMNMALLSLCINDLRLFLIPRSPPQPTPGAPGFGSGAASID